MNDAINKVRIWLTQARDTDLCGAITIRVRDGRPVLIETTTQHKPAQESLNHDTRNF